MDDAAQAFVALQAEVATLRQTVEALPAIVEGATRTTDYTPTLGAVVKVLTQVEARIVAIQDHPALKMTPEQHGRAIGRAGAEAFTEAARVMRDEADALKRERMHLAGVVGQARTRAEQQRWLICGGGIGLAIGLMVPPFLSLLARG
jgi:ubiquinone biosynthesis protein UbiJ